MPLTIKLYRFLSHAVIPFSWIIIIYRALRNKEDLQRVKERLGKSRIRDESEYIYMQPVLESFYLYCHYQKNC